MPDASLSKSNLRAAVWSKTDGKCWYCGKQTNPWIDFCIDHVVALSNNGSNEIENLVPCCFTCNRRKNNRELEEFRLYISKITGTLFSQEQIDYLLSQNIQLPNREPYVFYFEKEGLK